MTQAVVTQLQAITFAYDIERLTQDFTGREWVLKEVDRWLSLDNQRFLLLIGEPGAGKSTIAARLTQIHKDIVAHHFCQADNPDTLKPGQTVRSLSAQLMQTLPGYSQALLNTIRSPTLAAKVNITCEEASNGEIKDVFIANLKSSNEGNEGQEDLENLLEVLIRAPLAALGDYQEPLPTRAIFLVDGLDVAISRAEEEATQDDEDIVTLLAALSEAENLPSWVRFILTSRPDRRVLREFEPLQPYKLEAAVAEDSAVQPKETALPNCLYRLNEMSDENQADIQQYIQKRVEQPVFQMLLTDAQMSKQSLVEALTEQAQGNFRYVCCLLDDTETGKQSLNHLTGLPESLKQSYDQEWFMSAAFGAEYRSILAAVANVSKFLTEDELVSQTKLRPRLVRQALWGLRQYLDVNTKPDSENPETGEGRVETIETFAIFHPSLREYLLTYPE